MGRASGEGSGSKLLKILMGIDPFLEVWNSKPFWPPLRPAEAPEMELQIPEVTANFGPLETWDLGSVRIGIRSTALFRKELSNGYRCAQILDPRHRSMTYDPDLWPMTLIWSIWSILINFHWSLIINNFSCDQFWSILIDHWLLITFHWLLINLINFH